MNSQKTKRYLNAAEKSEMCILLSMRKFMEATIETWSKVNKPKEALKLARMVRTYSDKLISFMTAELDKTEKDGLAKLESTMHIVALTTDQAVKELKDIARMKDKTTLDTEDFLDLCSYAINICTTCTRFDYPKCSLHKMLIDNDIEAINKYAHNKCPYQYK